MICCLSKCKNCDKTDTAVKDIYKDWKQDAESKLLAELAEHGVLLWHLNKSLKRESRALEHGTMTTVIFLASGYPQPPKTPNYLLHFCKKCPEIDLA